MHLLLMSHTNVPWTEWFARFFVERGDIVKVVSVSPDRIEGIDVEFVGIEPFDKFKNKRVFFTCIPRLRSIIRDFRPDLVFATYLASDGLSAALSWRGPLAVAAVGGDVKDQAGRKGLSLWLRERTIQYVCRRADLVNTVSQGLTDELMRLGVPRSKIEMIPFGVDVQAFCPARDMPRKVPTRLICTRKHEEIYDIPVVLDALVRLKAIGRSFQCVFTAGGHLLDEHRSLARDLGLDDRVTFTGHLRHGELPELLRQADIYISASRDDGTSVSLLEAMASGLLPVVSRIEANLPWVEDEKNGLLFDRGDSDGLATALARVLDDADLRRCAFDVNRARISQDADMKRNMERLAGHFQQLINRRSPSSVNACAS